MKTNSLRGVGGGHNPVSSRLQDIPLRFDFWHVLRSSAAIWDRSSLFYSHAPFRSAKSMTSILRITSDFFLWLGIHLNSGEITFIISSDHLVNQQTH